MSITTTTVRRIRALLSEGLTFAQVAKTVGVSVQTVWAYSTDERAEYYRQYLRDYYAKRKLEPGFMERRREAAKRALQKRKHDVK